MASERAMVEGFCGSISSLLFFTASEMGEHPVAWAPKNLTGLSATSPSVTKFLECLVDLVDERASGHGHDDVVGEAPAELLGDFVADGLGALGVVGPQVDVDEAPVVALRNLRAEAVDLVIVAGDANQARAEYLGAEDLGGFEVGGNENPGVETKARRLRGDGIGEVAGGRAADGRESEGAGRGQGHGDDTVLKGKRRKADGVVFEVQAARADLCAEARGTRPAGSCRRAAPGL